MEEIYADKNMGVWWFGGLAVLIAAIGAAAADNTKAAYPGHGADFTVPHGEPGRVR